LWSPDRRSLSGAGPEEEQGSNGHFNTVYFSATRDDSLGRLYSFQTVAREGMALGGSRWSLVDVHQISQPVYRLFPDILNILLRELWLWRLSWNTGYKYVSRSIVGLNKKATKKEEEGRVTWLRWLLN
jgi:hypothetical protein